MNEIASYFLWGLIRILMVLFLPPLSSTFSSFATSLLGTGVSFSLCWGVLFFPVGETQFGTDLQMATINRLLLFLFPRFCKITTVLLPCPWRASSDKNGKGRTLPWSRAPGMEDKWWRNTCCFTPKGEIPCVSWDDLLILSLNSHASLPADKNSSESLAASYNLK